ncbi:MAG: hypothetical protein OQK09_14410 [Colwellia sp.]|nr:hypothetical protein [Colwellia sp.]MCW8865272.1 hypothetical protein [Colwellia sp.]MCW9082700.1 hypothetical protein [Colwellia sp.]
MKNFNRRAISVALLITLGAAFSVNAAETTSIENSISEMVVAQGQQVMSDLSTQLQASISEEINSFSIDFSFNESIAESLAWITDEEVASTSEDTNQAKQPEANEATETKSL